MHPFRSRILVPAAAAMIALGSVGTVTPVLAAESPEAAVNGLFDVVESGDVSRIDEFVCETDRAAARQTFDIRAQMGLDPDDPASDALGIEVTDRDIAVVAEAGDEATVRVRATVGVRIDEDRIEDLVRSILEADLGPEDPPVSDEDIEMMLGFMGSAFDQRQPVDAEVTVTREGDEWFVCGGIGELTGEPAEPEEPAAIVESGEGLCGLVGIEAVNSVSSVRYDMSQGFETVCSYYDTSSDDLASATISLNLGYELDEFRDFYGVDEELQVEGLPAFVGGSSLLVQVGGDVLQVSLSRGQETLAAAELVTEASGLAGLVIEVAPQVAAAMATPEPAPTPEPTPEVSLCEALSLEELNQFSGLGLDEIADSTSSSCTYSATDADPGFHFVNAYIASGVGGLDTYAMAFPDGEEATVAGRPALVGDQGIAGDYRVVVELPDGDSVLDASVFLDKNAEEPPVSAEEIVLLVAERVIEFTAGR